MNRRWFLSVLTCLPFGGRLLGRRRPPPVTPVVPVARWRLRPDGVIINCGQWEFCGHGTTDIRPGDPVWYDQDTCQLLTTQPPRHGSLVGVAESVEEWETLVGSRTLGPRQWRIVMRVAAGRMQ